MIQRNESGGRLGNKKSLGSGVRRGRKWTWSHGWDSGFRARQPSPRKAASRGAGCWAQAHSGVSSRVWAELKQEWRSKGSCYKGQHTEKAMFIIAQLSPCQLSFWYKSSPEFQMVKNLPAMQETQVWCLGQEDPLEEGMATHSSILAWRIPWAEEPGGLQSMELQRVGHDWATSTLNPFISAWLHAALTNCTHPRKQPASRQGPSPGPSWSPPSLQGRPPADSPPHR